MSSINIDTSRWPIVVHTAEGAPSNAEVDEYIRAATEILARKERHVTILDARRIREASAYTRARAREWLRAHHAELATYCAGTVYVVGSPLVRFALMTTLLVARLPTRYRVVEDLEDAVTWGLERLSVSSPSD